NASGQCAVPAGLGPVSQIAAGGGHTIALVADGSVACWGGNSYNQCAVPGFRSNAVQVAAGGSRTVIRLDPCVGGESGSDCNGNGVLDSCEIASGAQDKDADGMLDECEFARGDFDLDGLVGGADLAALLSLWGVTNAPFGDLNGDGEISGADLKLLRGNWGPY
ncbi:MAG: hypothetical protein WCI96_13960, partial [Planctomycetota bacterium]